MKVYKEKQFLIFDFEDGRKVKYDFATKQTIGIKGKPVKDLRSQLRDYSLDEIIECCEDKNYARFLAYIQREESRLYPITNIGTILDRVDRYSDCEQIFSAGIDDIFEDKINCKIHDIPKGLIKLCKKEGIQVTNQMIRDYKKNPDAFSIAFSLDYISLTPKDIIEIWKMTTRVRMPNTQYIYGDIESILHVLIEHYGYTAKSFWLYLDQLKTFEALENMRNTMRDLYDYANMMKAISPKFDKYPRHFLTTHAIASRNYNRLKQEFSEKEFQKRIDKSYECTFGDYVFVYPKSTQEIKDEAVQQTNCVASYIDKVINGYCHILFLRKKDKPNESLVTIEVRNNKIVQARRRFNDLITKEEEEIVKKWNEKYAKRQEVAA